MSQTNQNLTRLAFLIFVIAIVIVVIKIVVPRLQNKNNDGDVVKDGEESSRMRLLLPLYIYPGKEEYALAGKAMKTLGGRMDIIVNPNSGIDAIAPPKTEWVTALNQVSTNAGTSWHKLHGYISTKYGNRSKETAMAQMTGYVTLWSKWVGNFFFDEVSLSESKFAYYAELAAHAQKILPGSRIILNPGAIDSGTVLPPQLMSLVGITSAVIFETGRDSWYQMKAQPLPISKNAAIIALSTTFDPANISEDADFFADVKKKNIGSFFVNHLDCDYSSLPPYWDSLVEAIRKS